MASEAQTVKEMPEALHALLKEHANACKKGSNTFFNSKGGSGGEIIGNLSFAQGARDDSLFRTAAWLYKAGAPQNDAEKVVEILAKNCDPPFADWRAKVVSAYRGMPSERNIAEVVREFIRETTGPFRVTQMYKNLAIETQRDKKSAYKEVRRSAERGEVVATGRVDGEYRKLDRQLVKLDWESADPSKPLDIKMPFQIETLVNLYHKNIVVVAGAPDAGKSAFMLNVVANNMRSWRVRYFTSELSEQELRGRLELYEETFGEIPGGKWRFDAYERSRDFASVIEPNSLNIVDYMEVHKDFSLVAQWLDEIFQQLKHGVCFVALQKKRSTKDQEHDLGRGAEFSLERPRLYMAMDSGRLKIIKAKNWVSRDTNPNRKEFKFNLLGGCKFIEKSELQPSDPANYVMGKDKYGPTFERRDK